jgi:subtilase family serine protease
MKALHSFLVITAIVLAGVLTVQAQGSAAKPRINGVIDETQLVTLKGNVPPAARAEFDQGEVPAGTEMTHMRLVLSRTAVQEQALDEYMAAQQDPNSANYHQWLTPSQMGKYYGASDADINTILNWLTSRGLNIERVDSGRLSIAFSGRVGDVENAFHTQIHQFNANGESFFSNISEPRIPAALAPVVVGVARLNTIMPKPANHPGRPGSFDASTNKFIPSNDSGVLSPEYDYSCGSSTCFYVTPQDAATIYNSPLNASFPGTSANNGSGVTIGIGGVALIHGAVFWNYRNLFLGQTIPSPSTPTTEPCGPSEAVCSGTVAVQQQGQLTIFNVDHVTTNSATDEAYIDTELSGGIAPGANIYYYASTDLDSAVQQMLYDNQVNVFSLSFGQCEQSMGASYNLFYKTLWQQAAAQGIAVFVSTGDSGSAGCDYNVKYSTGGLAVNGLASTPYNVAVGGTDFYGLLSSFSTYINPETSKGTYYGTAKSFIPESTWNDSTTTNSTYNLNVNSGNGATAGSGGVSSCVNSSCTAGYSKPSWQSAPGVPADGARDLPDVSLFAANGYYYAAWLICTDGYNCAVSGGSFPFTAYGGTSTSAPATAGIFALVTQKAGGSIGLPNPELYKLASGGNASTIFNDTTQGNISVPCSSAPVSSQCVAAASGNFLTGYNTTAGYDLATGIGSLNITNLINNWGSATGVNAATVVITPSANPVTLGTSFTVGVSVNGSAADGGAPTGTVAMTISNTTTSYNGTYQTLVASGNDGTDTFSVAGSALPAGTYTLSIRYSGDGNYTTQVATISLIVESNPATVTLGTVPTTLYRSSTLPVTVTVTGSGTPTGTVTLSSGSYTSGAQTLTAGVLNFTIPAYSLTAGTDAITATYSGDSNNGGNNATSSNIAVTDSTYAVTATAVTLTAGSSTGNTSTITVTPSGQYAGTVTYTASITSSPAGAVHIPTVTVAPVGGLVFTSASSAAQTGTITVTTVSNAAVKALNKGAVSQNSNSGWFKLAGGSLFASFLLCLVPRARNWRKMMMAILLIVSASFAVMGCGSSGGSGGGGGGGGGGGNGTTVGAYTVTVTPTGSETGNTGTVRPGAITFTINVQ